ncbi:MAG: hypothetical protein VR68_16255 [Peptococcaceae bacterium BRH_c4a]|nr:MAG: hypothetical protein VR68_16255 [Peptococcaceae bacterium BRH_c4a]
MTFFIQENLFGIDILALKEINRNIEYTTVPDAPSHVIGLLNMRGQIVTLFNLAGMMGYSGEIREGPLNCIILKSRPDNPDYIGFIIDKPGSVVDIVEDICEPPPANINSIEKKFVSEVVRLENQLLMILHREAVFE